MQGNFKSQAAVDFLSAYGIVILTVTVALVLVSALAFQSFPTPGCTSPPGFDCNFIAISTGGVLTAKISQALGTQVTINGAACADQQNFTYDTPRYGNVNVNSLVTFYPSASGEYPPGNVIYSGSYDVLYLYCYQGSSSIATGKIGSQFTGYLWLNYSIPNYGNQVQKIATFTAEYS